LVETIVVEECHGFVAGLCGMDCFLYITVKMNRIGLEGGVENESNESRKIFSVTGEFL
jgi:hypothetical protein